MKHREADRCMKKRNGIGCNDSINDNRILYIPET